MLSEITRSKAHRYKIDIVRELLTVAFNREELINLCFRPEFKEVYDGITPAESAGSLARRLVDFAQRKGRLEKLLDLVRIYNELQFKVFYPRLLEESKFGAPDERALPAEQPSPITALQIERTRQDINCLNRCVELFQETEQIRHTLRGFFETTDDILNLWHESWQERWKASRSVIVSKYVPEYVEVSLQINQYLERLIGSQVQLQEHNWEKIEGSIRVLERAHREAEDSKEQLCRCCKQLGRRGWSDELHNQISAEIVELEDKFMILNNQIPEIRDDLYDGIKYFVQRMAHRFRI